MDNYGYEEDSEDEQSQPDLSGSDQGGCSDNEGFTPDMDIERIRFNPYRCGSKLLNRI